MSRFGKTDPVGKTKAKILLLSLAALLVAAALALGLIWLLSPLLHNQKMDPHGPRDVTALCAPGGLDSVSAQRQITLDFAETYAFANQNSDRGYSTEEVIRVTDRYTLENTGNSGITLRIAYPFTDYSEGDPGFRMTVNGTPVTDWYSAWGNLDFSEKESRDAVPAKLADGSYFALAFPDWPQVGTPGNKAEVPGGEGPYNSPYLVYYLGELRIPAGGTATVEMAYPRNYASQIRFSPCAGEIPWESCTLALENAENIQITGENMGLTLTGGSGTLALDPDRADYAFSFAVRQPQA